MSMFQTVASLVTRVSFRLLDGTGMAYLVKRNEARIVASVLKRPPSEISQHIGHICEINLYKPGVLFLGHRQTV